MKKQIVAISGGGFSAQPGAYIDEFIINLRKTDRKVNIAFVASASNDAQGYIDKFYTAFQHENPSHLTIADLATSTIQENVNERRDGNYEELEGLGLVEGAFCPHYEEQERKEHFDAWAEQQVTSPIYKLYDNELLYLENGIVRAKLSAK